MDRRTNNVTKPVVISHYRYTGVASAAMRLTVTINSRFSFQHAGLQKAWR